MRRIIRRIIRVISTWATCDKATLKDAKKVNQLLKMKQRMKKMAKKSMNELINQINSALDGVIETPQIRI